MGSNLNKKNIDFDIIENGSITSVPGFYASACHCGLKSSGKPDICIIYSPGGSVCSGIFTTNKFQAASVIITKKQLEKTKNIKAIIVNSGIANACNGKKGHENALETIDIAAHQLDIDKKNILISSTGVIGQQLPMEKIKKGISICSDILSADGGHDAAKAILTTDLVTKETAVKIKTVSGEDIMICGMAKGSGMIEPNMATLLVFITTNVKISGKLLDSLLLEEAEESFNHITVDGCQSTNDMIIVMANSKSNVILDNKAGKYYKEFKNAFSYVMRDLARKIILDGEGATKLIEIKIINVKKKSDAKILAFKVANSNLFKTAMFGQDLNWGRINSALGSAECNFDPDKVNIYIEDVLVVKNGMGVDFNRKYTDKIMKRKEIKFTVDLNSGKEEFNVLTSDLSIDYVKINALYHT
ncbi:MAG: bifunctional glutamate N-acetyltransferase/amino-acid acetyltransferase ArgJ [Actinomycetota bacterium]|nr:bifunctional glutamate N-acetyltransferase/amino-acid acetyltransferase ArgJ [Actinomycetota bacterium]